MVTLPFLAPMETLTRVSSRSDSRPSSSSSPGGRSRRPATPAPLPAAVAAPPSTDAAMDWAGILYYGDRRLARDLRRPDDRRRRLTRARR